MTETASSSSADLRYLERHPDDLQARAPAGGQRPIPRRFWRAEGKRRRGHQHAGLGISAAHTIAAAAELKVISSFRRGLRPGRRRCSPRAWHPDEYMMC